MPTLAPERRSSRVVRVDGPLDDGSLRNVTDLLSADADAPTVSVELDLSGVTDLSWQALGKLVERVKIARKNNREVRIVSQSEPFRRMVEALGAGKLLGLESA